MIGQNVKCQAKQVGYELVCGPNNREALLLSCQKIIFELLGRNESPPPNRSPGHPLLLRVRPASAGSGAAARSPMPGTDSDDSFPLKYKENKESIRN